VGKPTPERTIRDFNEARDDWVAMASAVNQLHLAQDITTSTLRHSIFYRPDAIAAVQTNSVKALKALHWH